MIAPVKYQYPESVRAAQQLRRGLSFGYQVSPDGVSSLVGRGWRDSYSATKRDRLAKPRSYRGGPQDLHLNPWSLWDLREISRELARESQLVRGAIQTLVTQVIHAGFGVPPNTGDEGLDAQVTDYLADWYDTCDARQEFHFWDLVDFSEQNEIRDGDSFYYLDPAGNGGLGSVSVHEGDQVLDPPDIGDDDNILHGIDRDPATWAPRRYWIAREAPLYNLGGFAGHAADGDWYRPYPYFQRDYAAGGVIHCYRPERMTGSRGTPWFSSTIREIDDVDGILVAERVAMRMSASRSTYETVTDPETFAQYVADPESLSYDLGTEGWEPGTHNYRPPGTEFGVVEHNRPADNFQAFIETQFRLFGLAAGLPLELVMLDFSRPNFAAQRVALQTAQRGFRKRQWHIFRRRIEPIRRFAIARGIRRGHLPDNPNIYRHREPSLPGWPYMRPAEDAKAAQTLVDAGLKSTYRTIAEQQSEPIDPNLEIERIQKERAQGIGTAGSAGTRPVAEPPEGDDDE